MTSLQKILFCLIATLFLPLTAESAPARKLEIGAVLALTGMGSAHGLGIREGIELARRDLSKNGWSIDVSYEDDATIPKNTISAVEKLAHDGVKYFIGPTWGILAKPAGPIFTRNKLLSLQPCNSSDFVSGLDAQNFFFHPPPTTSKSAMIDFLRKIPPARVAVVTNSSDWGLLWNRLYTEAAKEAGHEVIINSSLQFSELAGAQSTLVTKFRAQRVSILLETTAKENLAEFIRRFEQQQFKITVLSPDTIDAHTELSLNDKSQFVDGYTISPSFKNSFIKHFSEVFGRNPHKYSDLAYDAVMALTTAIDAVGDDVDAVKEYMVRTLNLEGYSGRIKFNQNHDVPGSGYEVTRTIEGPIN